MPIDGMGNGGRFAQLDGRCFLDPSLRCAWRYESSQLRWKAGSSQKQSQTLSASSGLMMAKKSLCRSEASDEEVQSEPDVVEGKHLARASRTLHRQVSRAWYASLVRNEPPTISGENGVIFPVGVEDVYANIYAWTHAPMRLRESRTSIGIEALSSFSICLEEAANGGAF
jgi:hypothetical protein